MQHIVMSQIINNPLVFAGLILLITGMVAFHSLLAKKLGANNATTGRVTLYAITIVALLCVATTILAFTVLPEIATTLNDGIDTVGLGDVVSSMQLFVTLAGVFLTLVVASLIFSFYVELAPIKSFFAVILGGLATFVATLALTPAYDSYTIARQADTSAMQQLASYNANTSSQKSNRKYFGGLQSKRLALQDMGHDTCMCADNVDCIRANYSNFEKYSNKHAKTYGEEERNNFLRALEKKVENCASVVYAEYSQPLPTSTKPTLEEAIATYYNEHGKWANTYLVKEIERLESQTISGNEHIAHVRFRYTPTEYSSKHSDGIDSHSFSYQVNQDGSYTVSAMGDTESAVFNNTVHEIQASYHALEQGFGTESLRQYKGQKLKITQLLGAPLEGTLAAFDDDALTIVTNLRGGEVSYQLELTNIAKIEVWY